VADALSRKSGGPLAALITRQIRLLRDLEEMRVEVGVTDSPNVMSQLNQVINLICMTKSKKPSKKILKKRKIMQKMQAELKKLKIEDDILKFGHRVCTPEVAEIKEIMKETHITLYTAHPESTKMYQDLRHNFW